MKGSREMVAAGDVLSTYWSQLVIKGAIDIDNICTCRTAREWGTICAHSVAVGLHHLKPAPETKSAAAQAQEKPFGLERDALGEPTELFIIFPPNLAQAAARGKV